MTSDLWLISLDFYYYRGWIEIHAHTNARARVRVCVLGPFGKWLFILSNLAVRHFVCSDFYAHATEKSCGYFKSKNDIKQEKKRSKHSIFHQNRETVLKGHAISFCAQDNNKLLRVYGAAFNDNELCYLRQTAQMRFRVPSRGPYTHLNHFSCQL